MSNYKPFRITIMQEQDGKPDETFEKYSDDGRIWIRIGDLDIGIKQSEDGQGVIIDCTDAEYCLQDLGQMTVWFDDIEKIEKS